MKSARRFETWSLIFFSENFLFSYVGMNDPCLERQLFKPNWFDS